MGKKIGAVIVLLSAIAGLNVFGQESILGLWKQVDDKSGKPETLVYIYEYQGKLFGRMMVSLETDGSVKDTIFIQEHKAEKLAGDPPYCGLDYVYNLVPKGKEYRGGIIDPRTGEEYDCRVWKDRDKLIVRGQLKGFGIFGRNQTWLIASTAELPPGFVLPDPAGFVPVIPKKK